MADCIFCRIAAGEIPLQLLHDEEKLVAFRDANPQAPTHVLIVPRRHVGSVAELTPEDNGLWWQMLRAATTVARSEGIDGTGYRLVANVGREGGQTVAHLHLHLMGGRPMSWPPG